MRTIEFDFEIGQRVIIRDLKITGPISAVQASQGGKLYCVDYWYDGLRHSAWVFSREIEASRIQ